MKFKILNLLAPILCALLAIAAIVMGVTSLMNHNKYLETTATIITINEEIEYINTGDSQNINYIYEVIVKYAVDGKVYEGDLGYHDDTMEEGQEITIMYNPENPEQIQEATTTGSIIFIVIGAIVFIISIAVFVKKIIAGV